MPAAGGRFVNVRTSTAASSKYEGVKAERGRAERRFDPEELPVCSGQTQICITNSGLFHFSDLNSSA